MVPPLWCGDGTLGKRRQTDEGIHLQFESTFQFSGLKKKTLQFQVQFSLNQLTAYHNTDQGSRTLELYNHNHVTQHNASIQSNSLKLEA